MITPRGAGVAGVMSAVVLHAACVPACMVWALTVAWTGAPTPASTLLLPRPPLPPHTDGRPGCKPRPGVARWPAPKGWHGPSSLLQSESRSLMAKVVQGTHAPSFPAACIAGQLLGSERWYYPRGQHPKQPGVRRWWWSGEAEVNRRGDATIAWMEGVRGQRAQPNPGNPPGTRVTTHSNKMLPIRIRAPSNAFLGPIQAFLVISWVRRCGRSVGSGFPNKMRCDSPYFATTELECKIGWEAETSSN